MKTYENKLDNELDNEYTNLDELKNAIIEDHLDLGLNEDSVKFTPTSDCVNLVCQIEVTDASGTGICGNIYKTVNKYFKTRFIAKFY